MSRVTRITSRRTEERDMQIAVIKWVRLQYSKNIANKVIHIANESQSTPWYRAILKKMGLRAGVSDLVIATPRCGYHGAWIELKTKKGRATKEQKEFLQEMKEEGYYTAVTYGYDETVKAIKEYLKL